MQSASSIWSNLLSNATVNIIEIVRNCVRGGYRGLVTRKNNSTMTKQKMYNLMQKDLPSHITSRSAFSQKKMFP
jgi:hypothetical protein